MENIIIESEPINNVRFPDEKCIQEERDGIQILGEKIVILQTEYIDELFIKGFRPENQIQIVDQMTITSRQNENEEYGNLPGPKIPLTIVSSENLFIEYDKKLKFNPDKCKIEKGKKYNILTKPKKPFMSKRTETLYIIKKTKIDDKHKKTEITEPKTSQLLLKPQKKDSILLKPSYQRIIRRGEEEEEEYIYEERGKKVIKKRTGTKDTTTVPRYRIDNKIQKIGQITYNPIPKPKLPKGVDESTSKVDRPKPQSKYIKREEEEEYEIEVEYHKKDKKIIKIIERPDKYIMEETCKFMIPSKYYGRGKTSYTKKTEKKSSNVPVSGGPKPSSLGLELQEIDDLDLQRTRPALELEYINSIEIVEKNRLPNEYVTGLIPENICDILIRSNENEKSQQQQVDNIEIIRRSQEEKRDDDNRETPKRPVNERYDGRSIVIRRPIVDYTRRLNYNYNRIITYDHRHNVDDNNHNNSYEGDNDNRNNCHHYNDRYNRDHNNRSLNINYDINIHDHRDYDREINNNRTYDININRTDSYNRNMDYTTYDDYYHRQRYIRSNCSVSVNRYNRNYNLNDDDRCNICDNMNNRYNDNYKRIISTRRTYEYDSQPHNEDGDNNDNNNNNNTTSSKYADSRKGKNYYMEKEKAKGKIIKEYQEDKYYEKEERTEYVKRLNLWNELNITKQETRLSIVPSVHNIIEKSSQYQIKYTYTQGMFNRWKNSIKEQGIVKLTVIDNKSRQETESDNENMNQNQQEQIIYNNSGRSNEDINIKENIDNNTNNSKDKIDPFKGMQKHDYTKYDDYIRSQSQRRSSKKEPQDKKKEFEDIKKNKGTLTYMINDENDKKDDDLPSYNRRGDMVQDDEDGRKKIDISKSSDIKYNEEDEKDENKTVNTMTYKINFKDKMEGGDNKYQLSDKNSFQSEPKRVPQQNKYTYQYQDKKNDKSDNMKKTKKIEYLRDYDDGVKKEKVIPQSTYQMKYQDQKDNEDDIKDTKSIHKKNSQMGKSSSQVEFDHRINKEKDVDDEKYSRVKGPNYIGGGQDKELKKPKMIKESRTYSYLGKDNNQNDDKPLQYRIDKEQVDNVFKAKKKMKTKKVEYLRDPNYA